MSEEEKIRKALNTALGDCGLVLTKVLDKPLNAKMRIDVALAYRLKQLGIRITTNGL
jgi:hypothetical protein